MVQDIVYKAVAREMGISSVKPGTFTSIGGDVSLGKHIEIVDQNPIGKSSRSNPATYLKAFDEIRKLFSEQQLSKQMGYNAGYFSFNSPGGRCEDCKGDGNISVEMQFMSCILWLFDRCTGCRACSRACEVVTMV